MAGGFLSMTSCGVYSTVCLSLSYLAHLSVLLVSFLCEIWQKTQVVDGHMGDESKDVKVTVRDEQEGKRKSQMPLKEFINPSMGDNAKDFLTTTTPQFRGSYDEPVQAASQVKGHAPNI